MALNLRRPPLRYGCPVLLARRGRLRPSPCRPRWRLQAPAPREAKCRPQWTPFRPRSASHGRHDARASRLCSDLDMLAVAPPWGGAMPLVRLRCSAPSMRARACPPAASQSPWWHAIGTPRSCPQRRGWVCAGSDICGAEEHRTCGRARQRASSSDSSRLFERSERSERSEFRDGPRDRVPQGTRSEAKGAAFERRRIPARGFACSVDANGNP